MGFGASILVAIPLPSRYEMAIKMRCPQRNDNSWPFRVTVKKI
jgi:hypothetical protein